MILERMEQDEIASEDQNLEELREALLTHLCTENKAFFRSQQINEPELSYADQREIASQLLNSSHSKFLQRFGMNLKKEHLKYFESRIYDEREQSEVDNIKKHILWNLENHGTIVRNRRYAALVKLIKDKKYFCESEMMARDPLLYETLIGQYQTPDEKRANRRPDPKTDTLVDVLLQGIDFDHTREIERKQRTEEESMLQNDDDSQQSITSSKTASDDADSESNHEQWGNFDEPQTSSAPPKTRKRPAKLITAAERDLLKEEFLGIMYSNFLSGRDSEFFDYTNVDTNEEYDDTLEKDRDFEDKYFEEDDTQDTPDPSPINNNDDSEDELDIYMKHLEKNMNTKQQEFEEEFDD